MRDRELEMFLYLNSTRNSLPAGRPGDKCPGRTTWFLPAGPAFGLDGSTVKRGMSRPWNPLMVDAWFEVRIGRVDRRTGRVHGPVQVHPFAFDPDVRLVHPPRVVCCLEPFAQAPIQLRGLPLNPAPDGDVIHRESTLGQ